MTTTPPTTPPPTAPVIIFDDEFHMYVLRDQAYAEAWWEMPDEYSRGFDATARPLRMTGEPHRIRLEPTGEEPDEAGLRRMVADHYRRYLPGQPPPSAPGLADFVAQLPREGE
ncbi:hypothetical protein [Streptomyces sp. NBC_00102]|uniref:hypothetical protein n=1 Tax=Streptomyces sp. NBC_00102 TaxID=2975652 RepID=UPI0022566215|nr:hypothetical protein [Streptomyces sp. NBC_00102]MCX5398944.1 hypothetical protein [Streptomyces sp. NBC_00102]